MSDIRKFPRTAHLRGSRFQHGDHDMEAVPFDELIGKHLVIEEKMDGANCGISFSPDGELLLQSRGHYLRGGPREKHFSLFKQWASARQEELFCVLGSRYVMYGEWMFAKHTMWYDALPHYFMEFDVLDVQTNEFLDTNARNMLLSRQTPGYPFYPVKVLASGTFKKLSELEDMIVRSHFVSDRRAANLLEAARNAGVSIEDATKHTDPLSDMEGLYIKWEDGVVKGRYKFVRESFTNSILDQDTHWHDRPIIQNKLIDGALEMMFE
jgi:hypothetical protein